ncbi:MAG: type II toxin-antitoxin system RelE/ParE family toxin [Gammaproteobacteria bacterium]
MKVQQTRLFARAAKKLHPGDKQRLDTAVRHLLETPESCELKRGDLSGVRVYKFNIQNQQILLGYLVDKTNSRLTLVSVGSHENFYRDMKQHLKTRRK